MQLNTAQKRVVQELDRNILLLASAGTGKTNTLSHRVDHILSSGRAKGEEILCLTFTNKACREMKERMIQIAGVKATAVKVATFHSFCYTILQEEAKLGEELFQDFLIIDEEDGQELLKEHVPAGMRITMMHLQSLVRVVKEYRSLFGYYSDNSEKDYRATIDRLESAHPELLHAYIGGETKRIFLESGPAYMSAYDRSLQALNGVDFTDLITMVHRLFQDETVRSRWQQQYRYIAVDEMQDTSHLEYVVMKSMWKDNCILLCGDYFQTIYEWRGSDPLPLIQSFKEEYNPLSIVFDENYRSNQMLFNASFAVLKRVFPELVQDMYDKEPRAVTAEQGEPITIYEGATDFKEAAYVFEHIGQVRHENPSASVGILVRNNRQAQDISQYFERFNEKLDEKEQLSFQLVEEVKFFRRQEIKDILAFFKLLVNPHDTVSAKRIIERFVSGVGAQRMKALEHRDVRQTGLKLTDFMDMPIFEREPYEALVQGLEQENVIVFDVESTGTNVLEDRIIQMAAIRIDKEGRIVDTFERFINPQVSVGPSEMVHGFSDIYLQEKGEDATVVLSAFTEFARGAVIVGHNVNYDMSILEAECKRHKVERLVHGGIYDTLDIYRRFYPNLRNHKLGYLSEYFPIDHTPTHNAMDDIIATAKLLIHGVKENIEPTKTQRMALVNQYRSYFANVASSMSTLRRKMYGEMPTQVLTYIMNDMKVRDYYVRRQEAKRLEHIRQLYRIMKELEEAGTTTGIDAIKEVLQMSSLSAGDSSHVLQNGQIIPILTIHQAKGSEFDHVYMMGMNQGTFPSSLAVRDGKLSEELRVFYVALTRAKKRLTMTYSLHDNYHKKKVPSEFIQYIPKEFLRFS